MYDAIDHQSGHLWSFGFRGTVPSRRDPEVIHHGAEILLLRDLYRQRPLGG